MPLALLIPLLAPVITELFKWFTASVIPNSIITTVPSTLIPTVSAAAGGALALVGPVLGVDFGIDPASGAVAGLAGSGVYGTVQAVRSSLAPSTNP